jgi:toxin HigB-1
MIRSFRSKALAQFAKTGNASKLNVPNVNRVRRILLALDGAQHPNEMNLPGYRFHGLKGREQGRFAVDASGNYRITFAFDGEDAVDVDMEDYH